MIIEKPTDDATLNLVSDTLKKGKQAIIFANSKRSAEKTAEDISSLIKGVKLTELKEKVLNALSHPTKQCERLSKCIEKGVAFHHAGLVADQRGLIETKFREGVVKIICATPTLCISGDTKIWHGASETEVSKFNNSGLLFVLSKNKLISMKAQKVQLIKNSSELIQISSVSGHSIKVTPNHKMFIKRKNWKMVLEAANVKKNDKIATIGKLNISKITTPSIKDFVLDHNVDVKNYTFGPKLSYFIGVMLGDGYSGAETANEKIKYKGSPCIVGIDDEIFSYAAEVCNKLKLNCRKTKTTHGIPQLVLGKNKWFREFLVRCGVEKRDKKHISDKLMEMNLENTASLLRGLFDTDGHLDKRVGPGFSNTSIKLIKQMQKMLLRFGIVSSIRKKKAGSMKIYGKEYKTMPCYELNIHQKKSIIDFYKFIGFNVKRKQEALIGLLGKICSNISYVSCNKCNYKIYKDIFSGRTKDHQRWGQVKLRVIKLLGEHGELGSRELKKLLGHEPRNKENRLNHHYELIKKRKIGSISNNEWFWSLNPIGKWIFDNILNKNNEVVEFFALQKCPLCENRLEWFIKKGWRYFDFEGDIFWDSIREVRRVECEEEVYDVVLPNKPNNNHLFVANGFIVHNSYGVDLPAFRVILKDLRRYSGFGLNWIPTLEYLQMAGRAGRPKFDNEGEAIAVARTDAEHDEIETRYIHGEPEEIYSKLAVEPVLRMYVLSLIATDFVNSKQQLIDFFGKTFWAYQFEDMGKIEIIIEKVIKMLEEFEFVTVEGSKGDFVSADELGSGKIKATVTGRRVAELYVDPLTAHKLICCCRKAANTSTREFSFLHMASNTIEMRQLLKVKAKEFDEVQEQLLKYEPYLLDNPPNLYDPEYDEFLASVKTALMMLGWVNEDSEEQLMEKYGIRPGELRVKLDNADWLLYAAEELTRILNFRGVVRELVKLRLRLDYGVKEELLPLLQLKGIGRVRGRRLYHNRIKTIEDLRKADLATLGQILGKGVAENVKKQLGEAVTEPIKRKRQGQVSLNKY